MDTITKKTISQFALLTLWMLGAGFANKAQAHNGELAIAKQMQGIVVDGSFDDWPPTATLHPIAHIEFGDPLVDENDLNASFRATFDMANQTLFVAVEVQDDSIVTPPSSQARWNNADGCEIYIDGTHATQTGAAIQHPFYGQSGSSQDGERVSVAAIRTGNVHRYEWRIQ